MVHPYFILKMFLVLTPSNFLLKWLKPFLINTELKFSIIKISHAYFFPLTNDIYDGHVKFLYNILHNNVLEICRNMLWNNLGWFVFQTMLVKTIILTLNFSLIKFLSKSYVAFLSNITSKYLVVANIHNHFSNPIYFWFIMTSWTTIFITIFSTFWRYIVINVKI